MEVYVHHIQRKHNITLLFDCELAENPIGNQEIPMGVEIADDTTEREETQELNITGTLYFCVKEEESMLNFIN